MGRRAALVLVLVAVIAGSAVAALRHRPLPGSEKPRLTPLAGTTEGLATGRTDLQGATKTLSARLAENPADGGAAARLAEIYLRRTRVDGTGGYAVEAERVLTEVLRREPGDYNALRAIGAVYLSQHRFSEAAASARRAIAVRPRDAWNFGVLGDALVELGDHERGFDAFDTMVRMRPDAASYARVAYAQELQGRIPDALRSMRMAAEATSPRDAESLAWHHAQIGDLLVRTGDRDEAAREFARAEFIFPGHPDAAAGRARLAAGADAAIRQSK